MKINKILSAGILLALAIGLLQTTGFAETSTRSGPVVYVIPIKNDIELALRSVVARGLREAKRQNAKAIILEIDTYGGRVDAAVEISKMLSDASAETVAFVNTKAISAGALLALSCKKIIMQEGGTMGAATPVFMNPAGGQPQETSEKIVSYVRAEFRSAAERNGHPVQVAEAMVDSDVGLPGVVEKGKLVVLDQRQALETRTALAVVKDRKGLLAYLGLEDCEVIELREYWTEDIARFFASPAITGLLMMIGMICIWLSIKTPGLGVPEMSAVICFILFFWGHSIAGLAGWETVLLFVIGVILLFTEVFIPGFGALGLIGIVCILCGLVLSLVEHPITSPFFQFSDIYPAFYVIGASMFGTILLVSLLARFLPKTNTYQRLVLSYSERSDAGFHSGEEKALDLPVGTRGSAASTLRPAGVASFERRRFDVVTEGDFITQGSEIEVIRVEGRRLVVRRIDSK